MADIVVAGLSMQMPLGPDTFGIGGPAIYAAVGARHAQMRTSLLTAVSADLPSSDMDIVRRLDGAPRRRSVLVDRPMIAWASPAVLGERGQGRLSDDPTRWRAMPPPGDVFQGEMLLLANGDPQWYADLLDPWRPPLVFMDIHMAWLQVREKPLQKCLSRAHILSLTEHEYQALPTAIKCSGLWAGGQRLLLVKRGRHGVSVLHGNTRRDLPPPKPAKVATDVGCGDLLLGLLAGGFVQRLAASPGASWSDLLAEAYLASLDTMAQLIESTYSAAFVHRRLAELGRGEGEK